MEIKNITEEFKYNKSTSVEEDASLINVEEKKGNKLENFENDTLSFNVDYHKAIKMLDKNRSLVMVFPDGQMMIGFREHFDDLYTYEYHDYSSKEKNNVYDASQEYGFRLEDFYSKVAVFKILKRS